MNINRVDFNQILGRHLMRQLRSSMYEVDVLVDDRIWDELREPEMAELNQSMIDVVRSRD